MESESASEPDSGVSFDAWNMLGGPLIVLIFLCTFVYCMWRAFCWIPRRRAMAIALCEEKLREQGLAVVHLVNRMPCMVQVRPSSCTTKRFRPPD